MDEAADHSAPVMHDSCCCCGRFECTWNASLKDLERDLLEAAVKGQALLLRHESHMADAESERRRMNSSIEQLEVEKAELEASNARTIEENRNLLDQLEDLNNIVSESDAQIECLTATLTSTRLELDRVNTSLRNAASLEAHLTKLEEEQAQIRAQLSTSEEGGRSAIQRWKRAEGTVGHLQEQIDRIEKEARAERERHIEVMGRMERRRAVEKELESAAGRLKGAAAVASLGKYNNGSNVVSHFVKDILQDNANLQMGIVELREMLEGSNAEVENLREQLHLHQPLDEGSSSQATLRTELFSVAESEVEEEPVIRPELHVHHHYHGPEIATKKPKKRRPVVTTGHFAGAPTLRAQSIRDWRSGTPSSAATILSQTSVTIPPVNHQQRWSTNTTSSFAASSVPSSPRRDSFIFDTIDHTCDSSRPTTPDSSAPSSIPGSPVLAARVQKLNRNPAYRSISMPAQLQMKDNVVPGQGSIGESVHEDVKEDFEDPNFSENSMSTPTTFILSSPQSIMSPAPETIPEEVEYEDSTTATESSYLDELSSRPQPLRRATSHESLLSVANIDIQSMRNKPSQMFQGSGFIPTSHFSPIMASLSSSKPVTSHMAAVGTPTFQRRNQDSGEYTRSLLSGPTRNTTDNKATLGKRVGGWVWSKWGVAPAVSSDNLRARAEHPIEAMLRNPGVNQNGPIKGLRPPRRTPSNVKAMKINNDLLQECLLET